MRTTPNQQHMSPREASRRPLSAPVSPRVPERAEEAGGARRAGPVGRFLRGLSGSLAGGGCVLALVVAVMHFWSIGQGREGPGVWSMLGQVAIAVLAVLVQRVADQRPGRRGNIACAVVFALMLGMLCIWWW